MRAQELLVLTVLTLGGLSCSPTPVTPALTPFASVPEPSPSPAPVVTSQALGCDDPEQVKPAIERFLALFNERRLEELVDLFLPDARTYYVARGAPVTNDFKEQGRAEIRQMLSERMQAGEVLVSVDRRDGGYGYPLVGRFPDGTERQLGMKFVYACRARPPGIQQLLIIPDPLQSATPASPSRQRSPFR